MITKIKKLFSAGLLCCAMVAVLTACNKDNTSDMKLDGACMSGGGTGAQRTVSCYRQC